MIKKAYTSPKADVVTFHTESLMTTASLIKTDETMGGGSALSNDKGGWSSESWADADSED